MTFVLDKQNILSRSDKSPKGSIDPAIQPLLNAINAHPDYVTTSSCSGRIVLLHTDNNFTKSRTRWLYVTHEPVTHSLYTHIIPDSNIWFRYEGAILHVKCAHMSAAHTFLSLAHAHGFKRTGITSATHHPTVELTSSESINTPLVQEGTILAHDNYLLALCTSANEMLRRNHGKLTALTRAMQSLRQ